MNDMLRKYGFLAQEIAKKMLFYEEGQRIPRVSDFAETFSLGRGTVQEALKLLENNQAIKLESRGHLGTFLIQKNQQKLLQISDIKQVVGVMPLPYSKKYEGLATGLTKQFEQIGLPMNMAFMRGSVARLRSLLDGRYDFAIVSKLAADDFMKNESDQLEIQLSFGKASYVSGHITFLADHSENEIRDGMKVGIDYNSKDQQYLTELECANKKVELVKSNYMQLLDMLKEKQIDAAIWNKDEIEQNFQLKTTPFTSQEARKVEKKITEAVCVIRSDQVHLKKIYDLINVQEVIRLQEKVVRKEIIPQY